MGGALSAIRVHKICIVCRISTFPVRAHEHTSGRSKSKILASALWTMCVHGMGAAVEV